MALLASTYALSVTIPVGNQNKPLSHSNSATEQQLGPVPDCDKRLHFQPPPRHNRRMKLRHAAALALVGWYLSVTNGGTVLKDCPDCEVGATPSSFSGPFKTKAGCERAGTDEVRNFYADAKKQGERIIRPTSFVCYERKEP
jgi:hypothetical protein